MDLAERSARDAAPVRLSVLDAGDGIAVVGAGVWPAGFCHPDPFAGGDVVDLAADGADGFPERGRGRVDGAALEVGVRVYADEVRGCDYGGVCGVDPAWHC